ncbi:hypothetical protein J2T13_003842 [Paenibacillus sp. DS2015]
MKEKKKNALGYTQSKAFYLMPSYLQSYVTEFKYLFHQTLNVQMQIWTYQKRIKIVITIMQTVV